MRAILAPSAGQPRDIGYSEDYVANSREYHERQRAKAERHRQKARGGDHRGMHVSHGGRDEEEQQIFQSEHLAPPAPLPAQDDVREDLEARRRAVFVQNLGDERVHLDRRRSSSLPVSPD